MMSCEVSGCKKPRTYGLYCESHYRRNLKHGSPVGGRTPHGEPLKYIFGKVINHKADTCLVWPYARTDSGYGRVFYKGKTRRAHRVVCELVNGPPPTDKHQAAHLCGRGHLGCVSPRHLAWKTGHENQADRLAHGTDIRGEKNGAAVLTADQALEISKLKGAEKQAQTAARYGVSQSTVSQIQRGDNWTHITGMGA
jgi:hypothetical protein